jgi:hypothetical protein
MLGKKQPNAGELLDFVGTTTIPATTQQFVVCDHFLVNIEEGAKPKIYNPGDCCGDWFLKKVEEPVAEHQLDYHKLVKGSLNGSIIAALGGAVKVETTLAEMFYLMCQQLNGEDGVLLTNAYANIFYVRDHKNVLRAVSCRWYGNGWHVHALSVDGPHGWNSGYRVFSRNSAFQDLWVFPTL